MDCCETRCETTPPPNRVPSLGTMSRQMIAQRALSFNGGIHNLGFEIYTQLNSNLGKICICPKSYKSVKNTPADAQSSVFDMKIHSDCGWNEIALKGYQQRMRV